MFILNLYCESVFKKKFKLRSYPIKYDSLYRKRKKCKPHMYSLLRGKMKAILWYEVNYIKLNWVQILKESFFFCNECKTL